MPKNDETSVVECCTWGVDHFVSSTLRLEYLADRVIVFEYVATSMTGFAAARQNRPFSCGRDGLVRRY